MPRQTLAYGTGGVAFLNTDNNPDPIDDTITGWVAGGGFEYKLRSNISFGVEGLYYAFSDEGSDGRIKLELDRDFWTVAARLTYHFGDRHDEPLK
jgi:outer membrane immunogenic protein